eukprot:14336389-Alexandrium_andersonii.AAC.1
MSQALWSSLELPSSLRSSPKLPEPLRTFITERSGAHKLAMALAKASSRSIITRVDTVAVPRQHDS